MVLGFHTRAQQSLGFQTRIKVSYTYPPSSDQAFLLESVSQVFLIGILKQEMLTILLERISIRESTTWPLSYHSRKLQPATWFSNVVP